MPMVPCPAMTSGSSKGWTKTEAPLGLELARAGVGLVEAVAEEDHLGAARLDRVHLHVGVVTGITMTALAPRRFAARATPCAWLPAEAQITPRPRSSRDRWAILL